MCPMIARSASILALAVSSAEPVSSPPTAYSARSPRSGQPNLTPSNSAGSSGPAVCRRWRGDAARRLWGGDVTGACGSRGNASCKQLGRAGEKVEAPSVNLRHRSFHRKAVKAILDRVTTGLHPKLPTIKRERGRQTHVALLACKGAAIGRAEAINVKSSDRHAAIRGTYRRKRLRVPTWPRGAMTDEVRKVPTSQ
jgi:hypothetical protein